MKKNIRNTITIILLAFIFNLTTVIAQCRIDTVMHYDYTAGSNNKALYSRTIYTYNINNNLLEELDQNWSPINKTWTNYSKLTSVYDIHNNQIEYLEQIWNNSIGLWENRIKYEKTFDTINNLTDQLHQKWNKTNNIWENYSKFKNKYNEYNNLI